jgi:hypothetical protein
LAVLVAVGIAGRAYWLRPAIPKTGTAVLRSVPDGSQVVVDGTEIGKTPITTTLPVGVHTVEFRSRNAKRTLLVNVTAGGEVVEGVDWTKKPTGRLHVSSDPPGARVLVDGTVRGVTPVTLADIAVGTHAVMLESKDGSVRRSVTIKADEMAEVSDSVFPGFLAIFSPFEVTITEGKRAIRLDDRNQVMLPPGPHDLRLENRALGYREVRRVEVQPGALTSFSIVPPRSSLAVTASAVAEVWVDGVAVGQTPLPNVPVDLGTREVLLRSAAGVERRVTVTATVKPVAVNVDF